MVLEQRASIAERDLEIERLKAQIDKLKRMQFGRKSEKLDRQIERLEAELEEMTASREPPRREVPRPGARARQRRRLQKASGHRARPFRNTCRAKSMCWNRADLS